MSVYAFSIIEINLIGNSNVVVTESGGGMSALTQNVGNESYCLDNIKLWTNNQDQLEQPLTISKTDPNGDVNVGVETPSIDSYSFISKFDLKMKCHPLDANFKMNYTILPNTTVKMTVGVNDKPSVTSNLSNLKILEKESGKGHLWKTIENSGIIYEQEDSDFSQKTLDQQYDEQLSEPEEQEITLSEPIDENNINFSGNISKNIKEVFENKRIKSNNRNNQIIVLLATTTILVCIASAINLKLILPFKK